MEGVRLSADAGASRIAVDTKVFSSPIRLGYELKSALETSSEASQPDAGESALTWATENFVA